ncbi:unnamed protein product [Rotaria sp. Silwood1]|nr:unnamed protein product [Rotaria sp. Silwood1]CAF0999411.1 unnamed protein product [Rotaria sp. Silwood1]CAF3420394.1 unnamed protein product [Rotaria sp. Silwood1]CAF4496045.1 unnamed protein product [Rotaria sp. Silwood1]CAF4688947.1 unnamed protein product [Rotaria sp. Silwood1]
MDSEDEPNSNGLCSPPSNVMTQTIAPNHFLLSTYKENIRSNIDIHNDDHSSTVSMNIDENIKKNISSYKCCLCRKIVDDATLTCAKCVNTGRFCPSKHDSCSNKRRQTLTNMLNSNDYEEFQQYSNKYSINTPAHLQCSDRMFLLKKFNTEKKSLQAEYQTKMEPVIRVHQMSEEILVRKSRLNLVNQSINRLREQIERGEKAKAETQERMRKRHSRIQLIKKKIYEINLVLNSSKDEIGKKNQLRIEQEQKLHFIRRQRLNEVYKYVFPIERVSSIKEDLASRIRALSSAQQPIVDETNNDWSENDESPSVGGDRYQIVNSCLPTNGDYQIDRLLLTTDVDNKTPDVDSLQSTLSHELYEVLSALSHACQLINVIAFYLHIALPFRLHQLEFNGDNLTTDRLRGDIAKLNANIVSSCLSQDIPIDNTNATHTLENLLKLLTFKQYHSRPKPVVYSQQYIDMLEEEVNEISRAYVTDYWFDDVEKDVIDLLNSDEWETIPQDYLIPDDPSIHERIISLPSTSGQQHQSVMSGSIDFLRNRGSSLFNSVFRSFARP